MKNYFFHKKIINKTIKKSFWKSLGIGFLILVAVPIASVILLVTVIGIPLAVIAVLAYVILLIVSRVFFAFFIVGL